jgi:SAM-dependent methyltransferase
LPRIAPFETYPDRYERWFIKHEYAYKSELRAVKNQVPEGKFGLEIGVGSGRFAAPLGIDLGVEPSRKMRMIAKKKKIKVIDAIAENLPFKNNIFDFILMVTTICFLDDIEASFREVFRILKEKGSFIIGFIDRNSAIGKKYEKNKESNVFYRVADFYSVEEVIDVLKKMNFRNFSFNQTIFHPLSAIKEKEEIKKGYGEGSFVTIKAIK